MTTPATQSPRKGARVRVLVPLVIMGAMFVVSGAPQALPTLPSGSDKVLHAAAYGVLGLSWCWALQGPTRSLRRTALVAAALAIAWGLSDEYYQSHVPGRVASLGDLAADALGASLACAGWAWFAARAGRKVDEGAARPGEA